MSWSLMIAALVSVSGIADQTSEPAGSASKAVKITRAPDAPKDLRKAPRGKKNRVVYESIYRDGVEPMDALELETRLVYSEILAANCGKYANDIMWPIIEVIENRIAEMKRVHGPDAEPVQRVAFGESQFASSLHSYTDLYKDGDAFTGDRSHADEFLFPQEINLFNKIKTAISEVHAGKYKRKHPKATHYFLHKHGAKYRDQEDWKRKGKLVPPEAQYGNRCVGVFNVDKGYVDKRYKK